MKPKILPRKAKKREEPDTIRRTRFFDAYNVDFLAVSLTKICERDDIDIAPSTGRLWLRQRNIKGDLAYRRQRPQYKKKLGPHFKLSDQVLDELLDVNDPAHALRYDQQVGKKHLKVSPATL
jgi:hypothetical protein